MIYLIAAICANLCMTFLMRYSEHHNRQLLCTEQSGIIWLEA